MMRLLLPLLLIASYVAPSARAQAAASEDKRAVDAPELDLIKVRDEIVHDSQSRIQEEILDRAFGRGKASVFIDADLELLARRKENIRGGSGLAEKYREKGAKGAGFATRFLLPGVPKQANINDESKGKPEAAQGQTAQQTRIDQEETYAQQLTFKKFVVTVIHDASILEEGLEEAKAAGKPAEGKDAAGADKAVAEKDGTGKDKPEVAVPAAKNLGQERIDEVRGLIVEAMKPYGVRPEDVLFRPARYHVPKKDWWQDLKEPKIYIPLLYAILFLLLLSWLFGPLRRFLQKYVEAIVQKPAAEINVESNIKPPDDLGDDGGAEENKLDIMIGRKAPEPPPDLTKKDEEEDMGAKFEPFAYINEENLKRLSNFFLLRREEPWLIATVLSYLPHEYARQVIALFPVEMQTKVAMEALKVRQVTREQIRAIDNEIKENIDFVVGGVKRLVNMLEESDPHTRRNILESLKNEKPVVYEYVRQNILLFEDIAGFPDREMQLIVRDLKTEQMARSLQGAPPELAQKFFKNMSENAASLLKESMEYIKDLSAGQIEEERAKIMEQVKTMEKAGKIQLRAGDDIGPFQEVLALEETRSSRFNKPREAAPPVQRDPAGAQAALMAGAQLMQAGQWEEAAAQLKSSVEKDPELWQANQYLGAALAQLGRTSEAVAAYEKVLVHNPDPELRAWVESARAQTR